MQILCSVLRLFIFFFLYNKSNSAQVEPETSHSFSIAEMVYLLKLKFLFFTYLEEHALELQNKLDTVNYALERMKERLRKFEINFDDSILNQFKRFALLRNLHLDWPQWLLLIKNSTGNARIESIKKLRKNCPDLEDFRDASNAIFRIIDYYLLSPEELTKGLLKGIQYNAHLSAPDCYALGQYAYNEQYYDKSTIWFELSLASYYNASKQPLYEMLGYLPTQFNEAYKTSLSKLLSKKEMLSRRPRAKLPPICHTGSKVSTKLQCYYDTQTVPFLRIAPFKVEPVNLEPYMAIYYDVIYDGEIEELKKLALPRQMPSLVVNATTGKQFHDKERFSKGAHLQGDASSATRKVNQRTIDMTGLDIQGSDQLQVINYGIGGHFNTHTDYYDEGIVRQRRGDRVVTVLFYLSDVPQGGATAFPHLELAFYPEKGKALVWHNLDHALKVYPCTVHLGCPVIFGSKWIATKWIYSLHQTFLRPCKLIN